jgi:hypothetical protein
LVTHFNPDASAAYVVLSRAHDAQRPEEHHAMRTLKRNLRCLCRSLSIAPAVVLAALVALVACPPAMAQALPPEMTATSPNGWTYVDKATGLMIETKCERLGDGDSVSYSLDFPGRPDVVTSAQNVSEAMICAPVDHTANGFTLRMIDVDGNTVNDAWVFWVAIYPTEYDDPDSNLMIETDCLWLGDGDSVAYDLDFPGTPAVVTVAQAYSVPKMACPVNHGPDGFSVALRDHDGASVSEAWVLWVAIYPLQYDDPNSNLMIEGNCAQRDDYEQVNYAQGFDGSPNVVTCAQTSWQPHVTCPVNHSTSGFRLASQDHTGAAVSDAWTFYLAFYPLKYDGSESPPSICFDPTSLEQTCYAGHDAASQSFEVWNCGGGTLEYTITTDADTGWNEYMNRYAIIVMGGNVSGQMYDWYWGDTYGMYTELIDRGFTPENIYFLSYGWQADAHPMDVDALSTTANIQAAYTWAAMHCGPDDLCYIYWVDHGSPTHFITHDGQISHVQLGVMTDAIGAMQVIGAYNPCYSGAVIDDVSREGVISITSQDADHTNSWGWAGKWRQALRGGTDADPTDTNGDGYICMCEAFEWIGPKSQDQGEHSMYDDNGDMIGSEIDDPTFDPETPGMDGYMGRCYSLNGWRLPDSEPRQVWYWCDPTSGDSAGEHDVIQVHYDSDTLPPGVYEGEIMISDPDADNSPQFIPVTLTVEPDCVADLNGDGTRDLADLGILLASYNVDDGGDVDGDGDTDLADLGSLLAVYGIPCP